MTNSPAIWSHLPCLILLISPLRFLLFFPIPSVLLLKGLDDAVRLVYIVGIVHL